jgi:DNA-directed RNA polymerase subunit H
MNYDSIDILYRSRKTLLTLLEKDGYNTVPFSKFSPKEILEMLKGGEKAFQMDLTRPEEAAVGGITNCRVVVSLAKLKLRLSGWISKVNDPEDDMYVDPATTELVVVLLQEPVIPAFHSVAIQQYARHKLRVRFFEARHIVNNPLDSFLVPRHEKVKEEEIAALLKNLHCTSRSKLPIIRFHEDAIARILGLVPGDIVKIYRASPTALVYEPYYRVCVP